MSEKPTTAEWHEHYAECLDHMKALDARNKELQQQLEAVMEIVKAVAYTGVDFGYGNYHPEQKHIDKAREIIEAQSNNKEG